MGLSGDILRAIEDMGFEEASPIQGKTIPIALKGSDVIGQAQTGTGKTAAFGIPVAEVLPARMNRVGALILTPTRELCIQVSEELSKITKYKKTKVVPIFGGQPIERQIRALRFGVGIVVGTPGRVMDHLRRGTLRLDTVRVIVLDEADEMLDMGFVDDITFILQHIPAERQTLLFSATMPQEILALSKRYMRNPELVSISREQLTVPLIDQVFYEVRGHDKVDALSRIVDSEEISRAIVFCRTKRGVDDLAESLQNRGYLAEGIHGDLNQAQRSRVMSRFRDGSLELLVATDVAARGLDIENVSHVINFDVPQDPESYIHRIGRTGRAGRSGTAITLIHPREFQQLRLIERLIKTRVKRCELPSVGDIVDRQRELIKTRLVKIVEGGGLDQYRAVVDELGDELDPVDVAAAALKLHIEGDRIGSEKTERRQDFGETGAEPGMVRFFINVGRVQGIAPADIVRGIAAQSEIPGDTIGKIDIFDRFTFVEVPREAAARVMESMKRSSIKGQTVNIEPAKPR